jgi:hypothetical protein
MAVAENFGEACPASAPFFGYMGAAAALIFASACPARRVPRSRRLFWRALVPRGALSRARGAAGHRTVAAAAQERCAASWPTRGAAPCGWPQTHASDGGTGTPCGARLLWGAGAVSNPMRAREGRAVSARTGSAVHAHCAGLREQHGSAAGPASVPSMQCLDRSAQRG